MQVAGGGSKAIHATLWKRKSEGPKVVLKFSRGVVSCHRCLMSMIMSGCDGSLMRSLSPEAAPSFAELDPGVVYCGSIWIERRQV